MIWRFKSMAKTPEYTKNAIDTYRNKFDMLQIRLPKETKLKNRIREAYGKDLNAKIIELLEKDLEQREKQDAKTAQIIKEDFNIMSKEIEKETIAAGIGDLTPEREKEIKAKLDAQIAEYEAKKAEQGQQAPRKDSFFEKLEQLKKDNEAGQLALNVREDI